MGGIARVGAALGIAGAVGTAGLMVTSRLQGARHDVRNAAAANGDPSARGKSDAVGLNFDGGARLGMYGLAALSLPASLIALKTGHGVAAATLAGTGLGLAGAATVAGNGFSIGANTSAAGNALNALIHTAFRPAQPKLADQLPVPGARVDDAPRPTADEVRRLQLRHLPGTPDMERARRDARRTLDSLDFSKRDLVIWVPGTGGHKIADSWKSAVQERFGDRASQTYMDYPAEWNVGPSAATGMETLRLVLAGIAERGGDHRVLLAGQSQGAWIIGDLMDEPPLRALVDRAVLFGQPGFAATDYADRRDPKVVEVSDANDPITFELSDEDRAAFLRGMDEATRGSKLAAAPDLFRVAVDNPGHGAYFAAKLLDPERWGGDNDPHMYAENFRDGAAWLDDGSR